jgi:hypothetical protein
VPSESGANVSCQAAGGAGIRIMGLPSAENVGGSVL